MGQPPKRNPDESRGAVEQQQRNGELVEIPERAAAFAESLPWRPIQSLKARLEGRDPCEPGASIPCGHQRELFGPDEPIADPHWYVIRYWQDVSGPGFDEFARVIAALGYMARYVRPYDPRPLIGRYLEIGEYVYWSIG